MIALGAFSPISSANHSITELLSTGPSGGNGQCANAIDDDADGKVNDGCPAVGAPETGTQCDNAIDDDADGKVNDGCPALGVAEMSFAATYDASSADGQRVFFETDERLVSADTDSDFDIYERSGNTTTLVSTGPNGEEAGPFVFFDGISEDGTHVLFDTDVKLVSADHDNFIDLYDRSGGTTTLISTGPSGGNGQFDVFLGFGPGAVSKDGTHVFFETDESLVRSDTDGSTDVYEHFGTTTNLVSGGSAATPAFFDGASQDGTHVFFETDEPLASSLDTDTFTDIYERFGGNTSLVSAGGSGPFAALFDGISQDGTHAFFDTQDSLVSADTDGSVDVYERSGGNTSLVSTGPGGGNGAFSANYEGNSQDGGRVFFTTFESLIAGSDSDTFRDVYERSGGNTSLVSTGPSGGNGAQNASFGGNSQDGTHVFFTTQESLTSDDVDAKVDVYDRSGGATTLVSASSNLPTSALDAFFDGSSQNGSRVFFETAEKLTPGDTDSATDIYERFAGNTTLISTGPNGGNSSNAPFFDGASQDGTRLFFDTRDSLVGGDTDGALDIYVAEVDLRYPRPTSFIPSSPLRIPLVPRFKECVAPGTGSTHGGTLPVKTGCTPPTLESAVATLGSCTTLPPPSAGGIPCRVGLARVDVCVVQVPCPAPGPASPDVWLRGNASDIICSGTATAAACPGGAGSDYNPNAASVYGCNLEPPANSNKNFPSTTCPIPASGATPCVSPCSPTTGADMTAVATIPRSGSTAQGNAIRVTDHFNNQPSPGDPPGCQSTSDCSATVLDQAFPVPVECHATAAAGLGSYCGLNTTANALVSGVVVANKAAVVEIGQIEIQDVGADGTRNNSDDKVFAVEGIFIP